MSYDNDSGKIESLLLESAKNTEGIIDEPKSNVIMNRFDNYAAAYQLRAYTNKPDEYVIIQSELRKNIYKIFQKNRLDLTTPAIYRTLSDNRGPIVDEAENTGKR